MRLALIQLIDSAFPTGAFSHSFGLETALQEGRVTNAPELEEWLYSYLTGSLAPMEGVGVYWAHRYAEELAGCHAERGLTGADAETNLKMLDRRLTLAKLARESREGGIKIGKRYLRVAGELYPEAALERYGDWIRRGECYGNACVVHGWICAHLRYLPRDAVASHLYAGVNSLVQNALRAMAIGQTEGQKVLKSLISAVEREAERLVQDPPPPDSMSGHALAQEIGAMRHETLYSRLFMS